MSTPTDNEEFSEPVKASAAIKNARAQVLRLKNPGKKSVKDLGKTIDRLTKPDLK